MEDPPGNPCAEESLRSEEHKKWWGYRNKRQKFRRPRPGCAPGYCHQIGADTRTSSGYSEMNT